MYFTGLWTLSGIFADKQCPKQLISANQNKEKENHSCCSCGLFFPFSYHTIRCNHVGRQNRTCAHVPVFHWGELEQTRVLVQRIVDAVPSTEPQVEWIRDWIHPSLNFSQPVYITSQLVHFSALTLCTAQPWQRVFAVLKLV